MNANLVVLKSDLKRALADELVSSKDLVNLIKDTLEEESNDHQQMSTKASCALNELNRDIPFTPTTPDYMSVTGVDSPFDGYNTIFGNETTAYYGTHLPGGESEDLISFS